MRSFVAPKRGMRKQTRRVLTPILAISYLHLTLTQRGAVIISLNSQMRKLSLREVKQFASGHRATAWWEEAGNGDGGFKLTFDPQTPVSHRGVLQEDSSNLLGFSSRRQLVPLARVVPKEKGSQRPRLGGRHGKQSAWLRNEGDSAKGFIKREDSLGRERIFPEALSRAANPGRSRHQDCSQQVHGKDLREGDEDTEEGTLKACSRLTSSRLSALTPQSTCCPSRGTSRARSCP
nr:PREDICTED: uncharacterized protein LOC103550708 isoform X2 [Equus przewalskii]